MTINLVQIYALDLAKGIRYLHDKNIIHGNVSAQNIYLDEHLNLKLSNFGLNDFSSHDYTDSERNLELDVSCLENFWEIFYKAPSKLTDVYSFATTLWEFYTRGKQPFKNELLRSNLSEFIRNRYILQQPKYCPNAIYHLMVCCWHPNEKFRPNLDQIYESLIRLETMPDKFGITEYLNRMILPRISGVNNKLYRISHLNSKFEDVSSKNYTRKTLGNKDTSNNSIQIYDEVVLNSEPEEDYSKESFIRKLSSVRMSQFSLKSRQSSNAGNYALHSLVQIKRPPIRLESRKETADCIKPSETDYGHSYAKIKLQKFNTNLIRPDLITPYDSDLQMVRCTSKQVEDFIFYERNMTRVASFAQINNSNSVSKCINTRIRNRSFGLDSVILPSVISKQCSSVSSTSGDITLMSSDASVPGTLSVGDIYLNSLSSQGNFLKSNSQEPIRISPHDYAQVNLENFHENEENSLESENSSLLAHNL